MLFKNILSLARSTIVAIIVAYIIINYIFSVIVVEGPSMEPTLHSKEKLLLIKFPLLFREPKIGEIIVFQSPINLKDYYIKRIIAKEEDLVEIKDGRIYVNDKLVEETYLMENNYTNATFENKWQVEKNNYFVLGDNRKEGGSTDSRFFGTVNRRDIIGIAYSRILPLKKFKINL